MAPPRQAAPRSAYHAAGFPAPCRARARLGPSVLVPFPDIAYHVVQAKAVGGEAADRRRSFPAVEALIGEGEGALPIIRQHRPVRRQFVAPGIIGAIDAAARGIFPDRKSVV